MCPRLRLHLRRRVSEGAGADGLEEEEGVFLDSRAVRVDEVYIALVVPRVADRPVTLAACTAIALKGPSSVRHILLTRRKVES